jgi:hypothetical protein
MLSSVTIILNVSLEELQKFVKGHNPDLDVDSMSSINF